jgi:hypothetical protein
MSTTFEIQAMFRQPVRFRELGLCHSACFEEPSTFCSQKDEAELMSLSIPTLPLISVL